MDQKYLKMTGRYDDLRQIRKKYGKKGYEFVKSRTLQEMESRYGRWMAENERTEEKRPLPEFLPLISVFLSSGRGEEAEAQVSAESVKKQVYQNWELISDPARKAKGEFIAFLDPGDVLAPDALYEMVKALNENPEYDLIYSDEDWISEDGKERFSPFFKPDWSPDLLMDFPYAEHLAFYRRTVAERAGEIRAGFSEAEAYDFLLKFTEICRGCRIGHVPKVLYHRKKHRKTVFRGCQEKKRRAEALRAVRQSALERRGLSGKTAAVPDMGQYQVVYQAEGAPLVSIIIPSKDNVQVLKRCMVSVRKLTIYKNYEIIVVDNGSSEENKAAVTELCKAENSKYLYEKQFFNFSAMCNQGAAAASGEYLLFLNDDTEVRLGDWLGILLGQAALKHAGAVGAKLLYPDSHKLQHAGVIGLKTGPCHGLQGADDRAVHYFGKNRVTWNYSAVTGACLLVSARKFREAGAFDEAIPVAYNDVDLCLRLYEKGYYNSVRNDVILYHYESLSRGEDNEDRLRNERELLYAKHPWYKEKDPFYSSNLTEDAVDYEIQAAKEPVFCRLKEFKAENLKIGEVLHFFIDQFEAGAKFHMHGWAYEGDGGSSLDTEVSLAFLGNRGKSYEAETQKVFRKDMAAAFPESRGLPFSGFQCDLDLACLEHGQEYQIALVVKGRQGRERSLRITDYVLPQKISADKALHVPESRRKQQFVSDNKMKAGIDHIEIAEEVVISGWGYISDRKDNHLWERKLLLKDDLENVWEIETEWKARPDLASLSKMGNSLMNSGFTAVLDKEALKQHGRCFQTGIVMRHIKTGDQRVCWTPERLDLQQH